MKIGILTQPLSTNYGGLLQNYALQQVLIHAGHEVETIDWRMGSFRIFLSVMKGKILSYMLPKRYVKPKYVLNTCERSVIQRNTNNFVEKYISRTCLVSSYRDFRRCAKKRCYDAYVVGSDQCWRPRYNAFLKAMFLNFVRDKDVKKISYAASFGTDRWEYSKKQTKVCANLVKKFNAVSVREDSGVKLCEECLGIEAKQVLDPTMLLKKEDYIKLIDIEKEPISKGNLFVYILDPTEMKNNFIKNVEKKTSLQIFTVFPKFQAENRTKDDVKNRIEECVYQSVTTWLRAFFDAEMIVVDSFHGMVFSIIFNKPFWVIGNERRGNTRFLSLLKQFGLESRLISMSDVEKFDCMESIDWVSVNRILGDYRSLSKKFLFDGLMN